MTDLERGASLGRYLVLDRLGHGGMGVVYAAYDPELDRKVAIKLLRPDRGTAAAETRRARLQREAQAMARLSHSNVITVHDVGTAGEQVFVAMELVDGVTLKRWLREQTRGWRQILDAFLAAGRGLAAAHDAGLVHRDFKPDNVLVGKDGAVRVTDFGLARSEGDVPDDLIAGTPAYMAPEQHRGHTADARSDQFAFCVALYEGLYGEHPFRSGSDISEMAATLDAKSPEAQDLDEISPSEAIALDVVEGRLRPAPSGTRVPTWVRRVVLRGLATDPEKRYPSMRELLAALGRDPGARRRRVALLGGTLALLSAVAALGLVRRGGNAADVCGGAPQRLAGVWDPAVRGQVEKAFTASGSPFAGAAFTRVAHDLDAYAASWSAMHVQACRATRVTQEQSEMLMDRRMACLEQRRGDLSALTTLFAHADVDVVKRSVDAVALLPRVDDCAHAETLLAREAPDSPAIATKVTALQARLAEVLVLATAGKPGPATEKAKALVADARALGYAPFTAQALLGLARALKYSGDFKGSEPVSLEAMSFAAAGHDDDTLIDILVELATVEARFLNNQGSARMLAATADAQAVRMGADELRRARVTTVEADVAYYDGHYQEALGRYKGVYDTYVRVYGPDSPMIASITVDLGDTLRKTGHPAEARALYEKMLQVITTAYGPDHPQAANALYNLGITAKEQGRYDEARDFLSRALAAGEKTFGPNHPNVANRADQLAYVELIQGRLDDAERLYQRAYDIRSKALGPTAATTLASLEGLGHVRAEQGRFAEALAVYQEVLKGKEAANGPEHDSVAVTLRNVANTLSKLGRYDEAVAAGDRMTAILRKVYGDGHRELADGLAAFAEVHARANRCDRAVPLLNEALAIQEMPENADDPEIIATLGVLAECEASSKPAEAVKHVTRALDLAREKKLEVGRLGDLRLVLARAQWNAGDHRAAIDTANQAVRDLGASPATAEDLKEAQTWLASHH